MAFYPSPAVQLLLLLSSLALAGLAQGIAPNGVCGTFTKQTTCGAQSNCCWTGYGPCRSVSKATDKFNCGSCGTVCKTKECCCNGLCTTTSDDNNNCGKCGNKCTGGKLCIAGSCKCSCEKGKLQCWTGTECVNWSGSYSSDRNNCGNCGNVCAAGLTCCSGRCIDTTSDPNHCGSCGKKLPLGSTCCKGVKSYTSSDAANCGSCGNKCSAGSTCCGGSCIDTSSDSKNCGSCGNQLASGSSCCTGISTDTSSDVNNCGTCGNICSAGSTCCGGSCIDTSSDSKNCGSCGNQCPSPLECVNGGLECGIYYPANMPEPSYPWRSVFELPEPGRGYIQCTANATTDVHIHFSPVTSDPTDRAWYGMYVGGNSNRESAILHFNADGTWYRDYGWLVQLENAGGLNDLWFLVDKTTNTLQVGKGVRGTESSIVIMSMWDPDFISDVQYMAFGHGLYATTYTNIAVHALEVSEVSD
ncbi:hypothetical protein M758_10G087300 [Ceratodon purpureus]|nr:hypothetical protein M758_10G087300 [Ceratodon purpureus]